MGREHKLAVVDKKKRKGRIEDTRDLERVLKKGASSKIDQVAGKVEKSGKKLVGQGSKYLKDKGVDKDIVDYGAKQITKHGGKAIRHIAGKAKGWLNDKYNKAKEWFKSKTRR